ncbi:pseudaminic acid cytidylyltransferase [Pontibacter cellulosilyticus]|uniref:Pseudaminic acid cytidylyltransferase n=1 Tax=Pontibacter cellulosilyticus TaxID=1720253 RepID=A0A923N634_9BACT|nr:pseudaminic acid cytidylyltransferase [Pontibacter cellulosilyticus]MBC5992146.1 pseudaminic acid cytidylyltransferase [Pontibacter cellulosilyticus]
MKAIAIIPARGGSKRIPRKNIRDFLGKPIIAYSIEAALNSGLFDEVMVSTDDAEIADIASKYGARVPFMRSAATSDDFATTAAVIKEVLENYSAAGKKFDLGCCLYPTAPLVNKASILATHELLTVQNHDTVFPVVKYSYPIWRSLKMEDSKVSMNWPEHVNSRSQDLPAAFHDAGQFYWFNVERFLQQQSLFTANSGAIELDELEVQDIDNLTDWKLAELKYQLLNQQEHAK